MRAEVSSGRSVFDNSSPTNDGKAGIGRRRHRLGRSRAAVASRLEGRGAHRDHLLGVLGAHGLHRIARIDQPLEGVGGDHLDDVGDLHDIEQRRHPGHEVLRIGGRRRDDGVVARRQRDDERRHRLGQHVLVGRILRDQHLGNAGELRRSLGRRTAILAGDENVDLGADCRGCGQRLGGRVLEALVVVLGNEEDRHL